MASQPGRVALASTMAVGIAAVSGLAWATPSARVSEASLARVTVASTSPISLTSKDTDALSKFRSATLGTVSLLTTSPGRRYFRIENATGPACFGVGPAIATDRVLGQIMCSPSFPSVQEPILDFTVFHGTPGDGIPDRIWRSEGFAADGVANVAFRASDGRLVAVTPVVSNVYRVQSPPIGASALVARAADGSVVATVPLGE